MSNHWWNPFAGMEQVAFKPVPEGYIYRAPNPWLFGPARYYLINENQKAELAMHHGRIVRLTFWMIVIAAGMGGPLAGSFHTAHPWMTLAASLLIGLAIGFALNMSLARKVGPIVAGLTPTSRRITRVDAFRIQATVMSRRWALSFAFLDLVLFALVVGAAVFGQQGWDATAWIGTVLFGGGMLYFAALYIAQRRQQVDAC